MPETVLPNVLTALIVFAGGAGLTWLTALFFVKVVKWPSEKTIRRWDRRLEGNQGYAGPSFWTGMLGLFVPFFIGIGITMSLGAPTENSPNYAGRVVGVQECARGPATLWWLDRCEVEVRFDPEPVKRVRDLQAAPEQPVVLSLDAQRPLEVGDPVVWKISTSVREGTTTHTYTLPFERDRPSLWPGALAGWVLAVVGSWWAGRWWSRSRPQHPIDKESIFKMWREVRVLERDLKRDRDAPGSGR